MLSVSVLLALERPAFFDGQRLTAADLTAAQQYNRDLRWLHNRALHDWGIALGYVASGAKGDSTVLVQPGFALDRLGHELILIDAITLPIPPVSGMSGGQPRTYYLTVSYLDDSDLSADAQIRQGDCDSSGAVSLPEKALLRWQEPSSGYRVGLDVVLATIQVQDCRLKKPVSLDDRRQITRVQQPYIASGQTPTSSTVWTLYPDEATAIGVSTQVSTASAAFQTTPRYQVEVIGERIVTNDAGNSVADGYVQIAAPSAVGFEVRMLINPNVVFMLPDGSPPAVLPLNGDLISAIHAQNWYVTWVGVEG